MRTREFLSDLIESRLSSADGRACCTASPLDADRHANWRVVFRFEDGEAVDVDLIDYH